MFPARQSRVVTSDPWGFYQHVVSRELSRSEESEALAYIEQAFDFFQAARNPQLGSKPLLYYYSFLNLVKVALLVRKVRIPRVLKHGLFDPKANQRTRLSLSGQVIQFPARANNRSEVYPEFVHLLGGEVLIDRKIKVLDLLSQVPSIHRTFVSVTGGHSYFLPIQRFTILRSQSQVWARVILLKSDRDVKLTLSRFQETRKFRQCLQRTYSDNTGEIWLETNPRAGIRRGVDTAIEKIAKELRDLGASTILTGPGFRHYLWIGRRRDLLPPLAAGYAAIFYLGSVTRYKPDVFDKILAGGYAWLVDEFLATYPLQFLYILASELARVDVVKPYASVDWGT